MMRRAGDVPRGGGSVQKEEQGVAGQGQAERHGKARLSIQAPRSMQARLFGVLGDPVDHSLSPAMHNAAFAAAGLPHVYLRYRVPAALLPSAVREAKALRMGGLNLTVPLKEAVLPLLDAVTREAERIGAVNTILFAAGGRTVGDNTDGRGL